MCKQPKQWKTIATIFIMQCASWPEAMAEACEDTCHRCRISWMQRTFWKCGMDTKFCHTPVPDSVPVTKLSTVFFENIYHRHKPTSFRLTGKVIYPVLPWAACAYDGLAGFLFKHLLMIFEKKLGIWNSSEMSLVNLGLTFWFSCPRHQLLPGPTSLRQRCFQPWPCMGACSIFFSLG